jgi:peptidase M23-like protein
VFGTRHAEHCGPKAVLLNMSRLAILLQACGSILALAHLWDARMRGSVWRSLHAYLLLSVIVLIAWRTIDLIRGQLSLQAYRRPRAHWPQLAAAALRVVVWLLLAAAVDVAMPDELFRHPGESPIKSWIAAGVLVLTAVLPRQPRWAPGDALFSVVLVVVCFDLSRALNDHTGEALDVESPFERSSYVLNAGAGPLVNEYAWCSGWTAATDLFPLTSDGRLRTGDGLRGFPCFGAPVLAPASGRIASVVDDRPDMPVGEVDREVPSGNTLSIQTRDGRYLLLAHLMQSSILVEEGDLVTAGQKVALCGNSGAARMPHLLLQARSRPVPCTEGEGAGVFALSFVNAQRFRAGAVRHGPFVVRRNDIIRPLTMNDAP